jgi:cardiolipin synthase
VSGLGTSFLRALVRAARRGVQVEIIVAGATDVKLVLLVSRGLYGYLMGHGVRIYEWHERILHAKTAVVDGEWVSIGSANLNERSFALDLEANVTVVSPELGAQMDAMFEAARARSRAIDPVVWRRRPAWARLVEWFFGLFRRLM